MNRQKNIAQCGIALVVVALCALFGIRSALAADGNAVVYGAADDTLAIRATGMPFADLARELSEETGIELQVPPDLAARAVTLHVTLPMERAVRQLFRQVGVRNHAVVYAANGRPRYLLLASEPARARASADDLDGDEDEDVGGYEPEDDDYEAAALDDELLDLSPPTLVAHVAPSRD